VTGAFVVGGVFARASYARSLSPAFAYRATRSLKVARLLRVGLSLDSPCVLLFLISLWANNETSGTSLARKFWIRWKKAVCSSSLRDRDANKREKVAETLDQPGLEERIKR